MKLFSEIKTKDIIPLKCDLQLNFPKHTVNRTVRQFKMKVFYETTENKENKSTVISNS